MDRNRQSSSFKTTTNSKNNLSNVEKKYDECVASKLGEKSNDSHTKLTNISSRLLSKK